MNIVDVIFFGSEEEETIFYELYQFTGTLYASGNRKKGTTTWKSGKTEIASHHEKGKISEGTA